MFRCASVLLTIGALLLCPFKCMGGIAARDADGTAVQRCPCCPSQPVPVENGTEECPSPSSPDDDCSCANCVCRGAVLSDDPLPLDVAGAVLELPADVPAADVALSHVRRAPPGSFPPYALTSGRLIRFALQSLQV